MSFVSAAGCRSPRQGFLFSFDRSVAGGHQSLGSVRFPEDMPRLLLLLLLLGCPGARPSPEVDGREEFDLQGSIIVNQLAISQVMEEQRHCDAGEDRELTFLTQFIHNSVFFLLIDV